jgi:hypothetical protein
MGLAQPRGFNERLQRRLVALALDATAAGSQQQLPGTVQR